MNSDVLRKDLFTKRKEPIRFPALGYDILLRFKSVGNLFFSSSRLVVCDPVTALDTEPFEMTLPEQELPLEFVFAETRDGEHLAFAILRLRDHPAVRWQPARLQGSQSSHWRDPEGFRVESSMLCIGDEEAVLELMALEEEDPTVYEHAVESRLKHGHVGASTTNCVVLDHQQLVTDFGHLLDDGTERIADVLLDPTRSAALLAGRAKPDLAIFDADCGFYSAHWGFDRQGERTMLVLDFRVLDIRFTPFGLR